MSVYPPLRMQPLSEVPKAALMCFLLPRAERRTALALRAYYEGPQKAEFPCAVLLGPGLPKDFMQGGVLSIPRELIVPVVESDIEIRPDLANDNMAAMLPQRKDPAVVFVISGDKRYLRVVEPPEHEEDPFAPVYMDLDTGQICHRIDDGATVAFRRWSLGLSPSAAEPYHPLLQYPLPTAQAAG